MWINIFIFGVIISFGFWVFERKQWGWGLKGSIIFASLLLLGLSVWLISGNQFLGQKTWYNTAPWREIILFLFMIAGMFASTLSKAIEKRRKAIEKLRNSGQPFEKPGIDWDTWEFAYPFLFSIITFGGLISQVGDQGLGILIIILAFQNGFFWQTLLKAK